MIQANMVVGYRENWFGKEIHYFFMDVRIAFLYITYCSHSLLILIMMHFLTCTSACLT